MQRFLTLALMGIILVTSCATPAGAVTDEQVRQAIAQTVQAIYGRENPQGNWDKAPAPNAKNKDRNHGGYTALALYALLSAGEEWQKNPKIDRALKFLQDADPIGTYARGLSAHVFAKLPEQQFGEDLTEDAYWLEEALVDEAGGYGYTKDTKRTDNSVTQYGVLGMWESAKRGRGVPTDYWQKVEKRMLRYQHPDGGWSYQQNGTSYGSMTTSGLALLYITLHYAHADDFVQPGKTETHTVMKAINRGLEWMAKNFSPSTNPGKGGQYLYYLVGVERVGLASGYKYFGTKDWYKSAAELLVQRGGGRGGNVADLAFKLIFLSRGRVPVLINKLKIPNYPWNNRPFDVSNLTSWASDEIERSVNWQVIPIETKPQEWLDAPLLWISGHKRLELTDKQKTKLLNYVALGGTIISHADNSSREFTTSVQQLCKQLWPNYELKQVPLDDWIYNVNYKVSRSQGFMSINNGVRHLWIHIPRDVGAVLQTNNFRDMQPWQTLMNIYHYATERGQIRPRLETHYEYRKPGQAGKTIRVGRGQYEGNWNPEPGAWINESIYLFNRKQVNVTHEPVKLEDLADSGVSLVHVTGTEATTFTAAQIEGIKQYVANGGVVMFESAGGKLAFSKSVEAMLKQAYPDKPVRPLSRNSELVTGDGYGGFNCSRVKYRVFFKMRGAMGNTPLLQAMEFDGRPRIIVSSEDLTEGMVNQPVWGVFGYASESAQRLMANATLWAAKINPSKEKPAEDQPAEQTPAQSNDNKKPQDKNKSAPAKEGNDLEKLFDT